MTEKEKLALIEKMVDGAHDYSIAVDVREGFYQGVLSCIGGIVCFEEGNNGR